MVNRANVLRSTCMELIAVENYTGEQENDQEEMIQRK